MFRFLLSPRWLAFHLLVVFGIVLMINLGFWQLRRLDQRRALNEAVASRVDLPPAPLDEVLVVGVEPDDVEWRPVTATGTYLADETFLVVNRSQGGIAGSLVVTPLQLDDARVLLVDRGFVPLGAEVPTAPDGTVSIEGRLRPSQERRTGQLSDVSTGDLLEAQRVDIPRLTAQLPSEPVPMYVDLVASQPAEASPYPQPAALPERTDGPHLSYAGQWFIFAVSVAVGWVLAVRKSVRSRRDAAARTPGVESPEAVGAAPTSSSG